MRFSAFICLFVGSLFLVSKSARADQFTFSYLFTPIPGFPTSVSASGVLTTSNLDPISNTYTITDIAGTRLFEGVTQNITGLIGPGGYAGNSNLLYAGDPLLDSSGISFTVDGIGNTGPNVNAFYDAFLGGYTENGDSIGVGTFVVTPVTGSVVPESNHPLLVLVGICGLSLVARRKYVK